MGTTSTNKVEEKSLSTKKKSSAEANYFSLEEIHSTKNMQFFIFFSFFVLALTADGATTKKHAIKNAIDFFDEDAFLDHLKTLFATKEEVESIQTTLGDACAKLDKQDVGARLPVELPMIITTL